MMKVDLEPEKRNLWLNRYACREPVNQGPLDVDSKRMTLHSFGRK